MDTYNELKSQLNDSQFVVYLKIAIQDPYKRIVFYENKEGLTGTLGAIGLGELGLTFNDLPVIVEKSDLAKAVRKEARSQVVWKTIDLATQTDGSGSGNIDQEQLDSILESINEKIDSKTKSTLRYKGQVERIGDLPSENNQEGDVYRVISANDAEYVWIGGDSPRWELLGKTIDLDGFYTKDEIDAKFESVATPEDVAAVQESITQEVENRNAAIAEVNDKFINYTEDYTAVEVLATDAVIPAGTDDDVTDLKYSSAVPAKMEAVFIIRLTCPPAESDVIVDWGDDTTFNTANTDVNSDLEIDGNEYNVIVRHTYTEPGRYIVKFHGKKYFGFGSKFKGALIETITCRMMAADLPIASHINAIGNLAYASKRLLKIDVPTYFLSAGMFNLNATFNNCKNLVSATGLRYFQSSVRNITWISNGCTALTNTDFIMPGYLRDGGIDHVFCDCPNLAVDISKLFPGSGFIGKGTYSAERAFYNCGSLTGTVPASMLWENTDITWTKTSEAFKNCSDAIRAQVPTSWGGDNTEIQAKLNAGYYDKVNKGLLEEVMSKMPKVQFIEGGTNESPAAVNLEPSVLYVALTSFIGTLPEAPKNGTIVQIGYEDNDQENMQVVASGSDTINKSTDPCRIGIDNYGSLVGNDSYRFVYRSGDWILL